jgi:hypothetical protein
MTQKISLLLLIIGSIIGISLTMLFSSCPAPPLSPEKSVIISTDNQEKKVLENERTFQQKTDSLNALEKNLSKKLNNSKKALEKARKNNYSLQARVLMLAGNTQCIGTSGYSDTDFPNKIKTEVENLVHAQSEKDSLQDNITEMMGEQLNNRQATINQQEQQYLSLKTSFNNSLVQQKLLEEQNEQWKKQFKRQKVKKKLKIVGTIILSALAFRYLMKYP